MQLAEKTQQAIDTYLEDKQELSFRRHLGASIIGRKCARQLWYTFRWAKQEKHKARVLRIFERGQLEEKRFIEWLRNIGCTVWDKDEKGEQFRIVDHSGHFGGSMDGVVKGIPDLPNDALACVSEFKTHNDKSFRQLVAKSVYGAKFEHFIQMQVYMHKAKLKFALYMAINKNDDAMHLEIIQHEPELAQQYIDRAEKIIFSQEAPQRISNSGSWYECKWCAYHGLCFGASKAAFNCRTCHYSNPVEDKQWHCEYATADIDKDLMIAGCTHHEYLPDLRIGV